jgi:hypothetical protein
MWWWQVLDSSSEGWLGRFREYRRQGVPHESESSREAIQSRRIEALPATEGRGRKLWKADRRRVGVDAKSTRGASLVL